MIDEQAWFERQFQFDLPAWMMPNIVERLRGTPARAEELVRSLAPDLLTRTVGDRWSMQEEIAHIWDLEPLWIGRVDDILTGAETMQPADLTNRKTHEAEHNSREIIEILTGLRAARLELVGRLDALDEDAVRSYALHPRLEQPMRVIDLAFFAAEHDDHHLAQVSRLKRTLGG